MRLLLAPTLLAVATLAGLFVALFGAGAWDLAAYALLAPLLILTVQVCVRAARALAKAPGDARQTDA